MLNNKPNWLWLGGEPIHKGSLNNNDKVTESNNGGVSLNIKKELTNENNEYSSIDQSTSVERYIEDILFSNNIELINTKCNVKHESDSDTESEYIPNVEELSCDNEDNKEDNLLNDDNNLNDMESIKVKQETPTIYIPPLPKFKNIIKMKCTSLNTTNPIKQEIFNVVNPTVNNLDDISMCIPKLEDSDIEIL